MKKLFSTTWNRSKQPRKQRKYRYNAPHHVKNKLLGAHLSPELRSEFGTRALSVRKNDTVKVMRGRFRGKTGRVNSINNIKLAAYIDGVESSRRDGTKIFVPVRASNLMIIEVHRDDKKRIKHGKKSPKTTGSA